MAIASDDDLATQIDYLKELNVCLDELARSEAREEALESRLREHEDAFASLTDQHTLLYAHLFNMHAQYSAAESKLRREREQLEAASREWEVKCQRLEAGLHVVGGADPLDSAALPAEAQLRAQVAHLTRQLAEFEVSDARWKRSSRHLQEELRASAGRSAMLASEWLEMEKALKFRVLYLESWKQGADDRMQRMDTALGASVLKRVADRQQQALVELLGKYRDVSSAFANMRVQYLALYDAPMQLSKAQHRVELLEAERRARTCPGEGEQGGGASRGVSTDRVLQARVAELELELKSQVDRVKRLEAGEERVDGGSDWQQALVLTALNGGEPVDHFGGDDSALAAENALLYDRINEVEQLYEALTRECAKYKGVASLAASQANVLSKKAVHIQSERENDAARLRQLAAASEDQSLVGHLQLELMQLRTTYQQFALKHDLVVESQQRALLERQQLEVAVERGAKELVEARDASRVKVLQLEATLTEVGTRDLSARNAKWDAFRKRLDGLEDDLRAEHSRRKRLELELQDSAQQLSGSAQDGRGGAATIVMAEVSRLRSRVEELETRERALIGQLEALAASSAGARSPTREQALRDELDDAKVLNEDLLRQVQTEQARVAELLTAVGTLERDQRELRARKEDVELELRQRLQQLECGGGGDDDNQRQHARESGGGGPRSPVLMQQKVGLYEQDQAALQQAAQATVASLKQLVEDKNALVREYQAKLAAVRAEVAQGKAQDRADAARLHRQLHDENQRMIAQLQDATATIRQLERSGKDKRALQAAEERHEQVLRTWKRSEEALEEARQRVRELQGELEVVTSERDLAEARAGEALEEIVTLQSSAEERLRLVQTLEQRVGAVRGEMKSKDGKLQLLREAIVKLKEEFLKAEDRHAVEMARAQHAVAATQLDGSRRRRKAEEQEQQEDEWRDEKQRLAAQVKMLQDKLALERSRASKKAGGGRQQQRREVDEEKEDGEADGAKVKTLEAEVKARAKEVEASAREAERLRAKVKEQVVSEARAVEALERRLQVVQAQNAALREAAKPVGDGGDSATKEEREQLQAEADAATEAARKLQRRVEVLSARLKEQQEAAAAKEEELAAERARGQQQQQELRRRQQREDKPATSGVSDKREVDKWKARASDLQRQNAFLQETLVLKRGEWEEVLRGQLERHEAQVARLHQRLARPYGRRRAASDEDESDGGRSDSRLQRQEARFLASQELRDELEALGQELRDREQQDMSKDTRLLELELEAETLRVECQRLQRAAAASVASKAGQEAQQSASSAWARGRAGEVASRSALRGDLAERAALEQVVENMKKVIDKLRGENDKLRRGQGGAPVTAEQFDRLRRQLRELKDARGRLEAQVEELQREVNELKKHKLRLQHKLRVATSASASSTAAEARRKDKDEQLKAAEHALAAAATTIAQREEELQRVTEELEQLQLEADKPVEEKRGASEREDELEEQVAALEDENARLASELAAFDGEFFEEIEDLKYKYAEAVRDKRAMERRLLHMEGQVAR